MSEGSLLNLVTFIDPLVASPEDSSIFNFLDTERVVWGLCRCVYCWLLQRPCCFGARSNGSLSILLVFVFFFPCWHLWSHWPMEEIVSIAFYSDISHMKSKVTCHHLEIGKVWLQKRVSIYSVSFWAICDGNVILTSFFKQRSSFFIFIFFCFIFFLFQFFMAGRARF